MNPQSLIPPKVRALIWIVRKAIWWKRERPIKKLRQRRKERKMLQGWKTYIGIGGMALSWLFGLLGVGDCTPEQAAQFGEAACASPAEIVASIADRLTFLGFLALGIYGRIKARPKQS